MFEYISDTHSLADFADHSNEYARQIKETRHPVVLTVDGKAELVVQDAESYQALLEAVERAETIAGVQRGIDQMRRGERRPASQAFAELRARLKSAEA